LLNSPSVQEGLFFFSRRVSGGAQPGFVDNVHHSPLQAPTILNGDCSNGFSRLSQARRVSSSGKTRLKPQLRKILLWTRVSVGYGAAHITFPELDFLPPLHPPYFSCKDKAFLGVLCGFAVCISNGFGGFRGGAKCLFRTGFLAASPPTLRMRPLYQLITKR
jgi:hypothetical protein